MQQSSTTLKLYCLVDISIEYFHFGPLRAVFENHIFQCEFYEFLSENLLDCNKFGVKILNNELIRQKDLPLWTKVEKILKKWGKVTLC
jgi:hypothetical protein